MHHESPQVLEDLPETFYPILLTQLFVCNSNKQRLSLCKYMINRNNKEEFKHNNSKSLELEDRVTQARKTQDQ